MMSLYRSLKEPKELLSSGDVGSSLNQLVLSSSVAVVVTELGSMMIRDCDIWTVT